MDILKHIPIGKENAISRNLLKKTTKLDDKEMRRQIAKARQHTPILNSQDGNGYYQPNKSETNEVEAFIRQESKRARAIFYNLKGAKEWLKKVDS